LSVPILNGSYELSDEDYLALSDMLNGIAWRYNGWSGLLAEDIEMELWIKTIEVIREMDGRVELNYIARCCYYRTIDMCRYAKTRNIEHSFDPSIIEMCTTDTEVVTDIDILSRPEMDDYSFMVLLDLTRLFPVDSKENKYLQLIAMYAGMREVDDESFLKELCDERMELVIAKRLGYADDTSNGYRKMRTRVRQVVAEYISTK